MNLILIRHADATWNNRRWPNDDERPLTPLGERQAAILGPALKRRVGAVNTFLTSPLVRARQTAEIVGDSAGWPPPRIHELDSQLVAALTSGRTTWATGLFGALAALDASTVAYVGHEPTLSQMVTLALTGIEEPPRAEMERAAAALIRFGGPMTPAEGILAWLVVPELLEDLPDDWG